MNEFAKLAAGILFLNPSAQLTEFAKVDFEVEITNVRQNIIDARSPLLVQILEKKAQIESKYRVKIRILSLGEILETKEEEFRLEALGEDDLKSIERFLDQLQEEMSDIYSVNKSGEAFYPLEGVEILLCGEISYRKWQETSQSYAIGTYFIERDIIAYNVLSEGDQKALIHHEIDHRIFRDRNAAKSQLSIGREYGAANYSSETHFSPNAAKNTSENHAYGSERIFSGCTDIPLSLIDEARIIASDYDREGFVLPEGCYEVLALREK